MNKLKLMALALAIGHRVGHPTTSIEGPGDGCDAEIQFGKSVSLQVGGDYVIVNRIGTDGGEWCMFSDEAHHPSQLELIAQDVRTALVLSQFGEWFVLGMLATLLAVDGDLWLAGELENDATRATTNDEWGGGDLREGCPYEEFAAGQDEMYVHTCRSIQYA